MRSGLRYRLVSKAGGIELVVSDDGIGMDVDQILKRDSARSLGLDGMRERAEMFGGSLSIESTPGEGTTVRAWWANSANEQMGPAPDHSAPGPAREGCKEPG